MSYGNYAQRPNEIINWTDDPLMTPVTALQLAEYLGLIFEDCGHESATSPGQTIPQEQTLDLMVLAATQAIIDYTGYDSSVRAWHYRADRYPERRPGLGGLAPMPALGQWWVTLPVKPIVSIENVTADDWEADEILGRVFIPGRYERPLTIDYKAGFAELPAWYEQATLEIAGYLFEHRGGCDVGDAIAQTGAKMLLRPYRRVTL